MSHRDRLDQLAGKLSIANQRIITLLMQVAHQKYPTVDNQYELLALTQARRAAENDLILAVDMVPCAES